MQPVRWIDAPLRRVARPSAAADPIPPTTLVAASWEVPVNSPTGADDQGKAVRQALASDESFGARPERGRDLDVSGKCGIARLIDNS